MGGGVMIIKSPSGSTPTYTLDVNGSMNCSTNFSCSGSISLTGSLTSSAGNLTINNGRISSSIHLETIISFILMFYNQQILFVNV